MDSLTRLNACGVIPVVVMDDIEQAFPTARALLAGDVDVMEITLRTEAGLEAIREVAAHCPEICVGAGTVTSVEQAKHALNAGAQFIVSPGFDKELVTWCIQEGVPITPGCVTPTEIMQALHLGVSVVKFFPANIYGGLAALKALAGPFGNIKFIPTGGTNAENLKDYLAADCVYAVGGSWLCPKKDISEANYEKIRQLCQQARNIALGYEFGHLGINCEEENSALELCEQLQSAFGFDRMAGTTSHFVTSAFEIMNNPYLGENGHIAIRTTNIHRAMVHLKKRGFEMDAGTAKYKADALVAIYLQRPFGGFAIHLLQK